MPLRIQQYSSPKINIYQKPSKPLNMNNYKKITVNTINNNDPNLKKHKINYQNYLSNCKKSAYCILTSNISSMKRKKSKQQHGYNSEDKEKNLSSLCNKYKTLNDLTQNNITICQSNINKNKNAIDEILAKISKLKENLKESFSLSNKNSPIKEIKKNTEINMSMNSDDCININNINVNKNYPPSSENRRTKKDINYSYDKSKDNSISYDYGDYDKLLQNEIIQKDKDFQFVLNKLISENKKLKNIASFSTLDQESSKRNCFTEAETDIEKKKRRLLRRYFKKKHNENINILHIKLLEYYYKVKCETLITVNRSKKFDMQNANNNININKNINISDIKNNSKDDDNYQNINNQTNQNNNGFITLNNNKQDNNINNYQDNKNQNNSDENKTNVNNQINNIQNDKESNKIDPNINNQNNINLNENQNNQEPKEEEKPKRDPEYEKRLEKSRKLRKLLANKEKQKKETLSKNFEIFFLNGLYTRIKAESLLLKQRINTDKNQVAKIEKKLSFDPKKIDVIDNKTIENKKPKNEKEQKLQELLLSIFNKKDKKITGILRNKFQKYNLRVKIISLKPYEKKKKTKKKKKSKTKKNENNGESNNLKKIESRNENFNSPLDKNKEYIKKLSNRVSIDKDQNKD